MGNILKIHEHSTSKLGNSSQKWCLKSPIPWHLPPCRNLCAGRAGDWRHHANRSAVPRPPSLGNKSLDLSAIILGSTSVVVYLVDHQ